MPKKTKKAAGAPSGVAAKAAQKQPKAKRKKDKKGAQPAQPPPPPPAEAAQRRRASGGVPTPGAFDNLRRLGPPNLAGPNEQPPGQRTLVVAEGGKAAKGKKAGKAQQADKPAKPGKAGQAKKPKSNEAKTANFAHKRLRRRIAAGVVLLAVLGVGVWLTVTMLFKIEHFEIQGECPYTVEEMQSAFGVAPGVAMYGFSVGDAQRRMLERLPYLERVDIHRRLPSTIRFQAVAAEERYAVPWEEGHLVLSDTLRVLRQAADAPEGLTLLEGLSQLEVAVGKPLALAESAQDNSAIPKDDSVSGTPPEPAQTALVPPSLRGSNSAGGGEEGGSGEGDAGEGVLPDGTAPPPEVELPPEVDPAQFYSASESFGALPVLLKALADCGLSDITRVDVSDTMDMKFEWQSRIIVRLGTHSGLADKLGFVVSLLDAQNPDGISPQARGTLDMGLYLITRQGVFSEGEI